MNIRETFGLVTSVIALVTVGYGVVIKAGWVISRAEASTMIEAATQTITQNAAQAVLDESKARERSDLELQKELAMDKLKLLLSVSNRNDVENLEVEQLKKRIDKISERLSELDD